MNKAPLIENLLEFIEKNQFQKINKVLISNYKKSSAEGSCLNLKNTAKLPLDLKICGNMKQDTREGYNKLNLNNSLTINGLTITNNQDGTITIDGTPNQGTQFNLSKEKLNLELNTDYIVSIKHISGTATLLSGSLFVLYYEKPTTTNGLVFKNGNETPTFQISNTPDRAPYLWFGFTSSSGASATFNNYRISIQIEKGKTVSPFEQFGQKPSIDFPSEITRVTGNVKNIIQNKNYYNINDKIVSHFGSDLKIDNEDWISVDVDNSSGKSTKFIDFWLKPNIILRPNKDYYVVLEIKKLNGKYLEIRPIDNFGNISQFDGVFNVYSQDLKAGDVLIKKIKTLSDFSKASTLNRSYISLNAGLKASATFRISILSEEVTTSNFIYTPYKKQIYQLPLGDKVLYGDENVRDYFDVKFDEDLYNCTGYKKITELKLIKNWNKYIFTGEENIFFSIVQGDYFLAQIRKTDLKRDTVIISNKFIYGPNWGTNYNVEKINSAYNQDPIIQFKILSSRLSEVSSEGFKKFLVENNIYVVYQLNNPEEEIITDVKLIEQIENMINNIQSYAEETNISSDAFLKIDFYKDKVLELEERLEKLENK